MFGLASKSHWPPAASTTKLRPKIMCDMFLETSHQMQYNYDISNENYLNLRSNWPLKILRFPKWPLILINPVSYDHILFAFDERFPKRCNMLILASILLLRLLEANDFWRPIPTWCTILKMPKQMQFSCEFRILKISKIGLSKSPWPHFEGEGGPIPKMFFQAFITPTRRHIFMKRKFWNLMVLKRYELGKWAAFRGWFLQDGGC